MHRREFFRLTGLGTAALWMARSTVAAAWTSQWHAEDAADFAIAYALQQGATYADACIGDCALTGHLSSFAQEGLPGVDLLGMRMATPLGWRNVVMQGVDKATIQRHLDIALDPAQPLLPAHAQWVAAQFCQEQAAAFRSSAPSLAADLNMALLRYGQRQQLPESRPHLLFCDLIVHH